MLLSNVLVTVTPSPQLSQLGRGWSYAQWASSTAQFSRSSKDAMIACLVEVSTRAFGADMTSYWAGRDADGFFDKVTRFCLLVDPQGMVAGWTGQHRKVFDGCACLFLDSSGVIPELQGGGLMSRLHARIIVREVLARTPRPVYLVTRTENPVVYCLLRDGCGSSNIWPSPHAGPSHRASAIATAASHWLGQRDKFDPASMLVRGAYDNLDALYGDLPSSGEAVTDEFFQNSLRPEDAFIIVARAFIPHVVRKWADREARIIGKVAVRRHVPARDRQLEE